LSSDVVNVEYIELNINDAVSPPFDQFSSPKRIAE